MVNSLDASIIKAAVEGDISCFKVLLQHQTDFKRRDPSQRIALHYVLMLPISFDESLKTNKEHIAELLIQQTPETLRCQDNAGDTPLHLMASQGFDSLLTKMLQQDPKAALIANNAGEYPIHSAILNQKINAIRSLLATNDMTTLIDFHENNLFHYAALSNNSEVLNLLFAEYSKQLPDLNGVNDNFQTPLDIAYKQGYQQIIDILQQHGAIQTHISP